MLTRPMSKCATCPKFLSGVCSGKPQPVARALATQVQDLRRDKREGDISSTFTTFSGRKPEPLPPRFRDLKVNLTSGFEEAIQKSWDKLIETLKVKTEEVATQREKMIPIADFKDVAAGTVPAETEAAVRRTGVMVVRNVMPEKEVNGLLSDAREYFAANPFRGFPSDEAQKVVYESYWSRSQVRARSHSNMLATQRYMLRYYHAPAEQRVDLSTPLSYCDRVQIRPPGDTKFALSPHVDGGGIERWEDKAYSSTYRAILQGRWQEYDPWDMTGRVEANMNMYNGPGGCSVFRAFQGWLGLSAHGPEQGTLVVHPILQESTAYWMLRPFFKPTVKGSLEGWKFSLDDTEGNVLFHGANPGTPQEHTPENHPHLRLEETMIPYPQVEPGDTVFWSADTIHGTEMKNTGTQDACVFYIPSVPLTDGNIVSIKTGQQMRQGHVILQYIAQQRDSFLKGVPPPDFPGGSGESQFADRATVADIASVEGKRALGLAPFERVAGGGRANAMRMAANKALGYASD